MIVKLDTFMNSGLLVKDMPAAIAVIVWWYVLRVVAATTHGISR